MTLFPGADNDIADNDSADNWVGDNLVRVPLTFMGRILN